MIQKLFASISVASAAIAIYSTTIEVALALEVGTQRTTSCPSASSTGATPPWLPEWVWSVGAIVLGALISGIVGWVVGLLQHRREAQWTRDRMGIAFVSEIGLLLAGVRSAIEGSRGDVCALGSKLHTYIDRTPVFDNNTDKLGLFEGLGGEIVGLYNNHRFYVRISADISDRLSSIPDEPGPRRRLLSRVEHDYDWFLSGLELWVETAQKTYDKLCNLCDIKFVDEVGETTTEAPRTPASR